MQVRAATAADLPVLQDIERAAGCVFAAIGMQAIAEDAPPGLDELEAFRRAGGAWVAAEPGAAPFAYLVAMPVDGCLHIEQVSVHPDAARRGIGRALIEHAAAVAAAGGRPALTLTTFADVPWNAPYYERCGFRRLDEDELSPGLRAIREAERAGGLDRWPRVAMLREL
jgi:GNAT superfamily N-acetyltransferase